MGPWLIKALNVVLLGASCYLVADVATEVGAAALEPAAIQPAATRPRSTSQSVAVAPSVILERNLFGAQLAGESQVTEESQQNVPLEATKLPLRLLGTAASSSEARSRAAVEDEKTRKHLVLAVGDRLTEAGLNRVKVTAGLSGFVSQIHDARGLHGDSVMVEQALRVIGNTQLLTVCHDGQR